MGSAGILNSGDKGLNDLHRDHMGMSQMKAVARSYMWWPGTDSNIENLAKSCVSSKAVKSAPSEAPMHPWLWPEQPWRCMCMWILQGR